MACDLGNAEVQKMITDKFMSLGVEFVTSYRGKLDANLYLDLFEMRLKTYEDSEVELVKRYEEEKRSDVGKNL